MSDRKEILGTAMALEADRDRLERVRSYQEKLLAGAEPVIDNTDDPVALMEAFARVLARAVRKHPVERRKLLNYALRRAEIHAGAHD